MTTPDLTRAQREDLVKWMRSGFRQYADVCGYWEGEIHRKIRAQVFRYGNYFGRILRGKIELSDEDDPQALRTDLYGLMKSGCPAAWLVELMLDATSDGVTISHLLDRAEFLHEQQISDKNVSVQLMRARMGGRTRASATGYHLALCYLLLKHFGYDHETLTQMLRAMQCVRRRVAPVANYLNLMGKITFTTGALQRRVHRFFDSDPARESVMRKDIRKHLSGAGGDSRKTFLGTS